MDAEERPLKIRKIHSNNDLSTATDQNIKDNQITDIQTEQAKNDSSGDEAQSPPDPDKNQQQDATNPVPMSKNALKKLRKQEKWEAGREFRKAKRKERLVAKRERLKLEKIESTASKINEQSSDTGSLARPPKSVPVPLTFLIDCGFDEQMHDKEIASISQQITRCYSETRKAPYRPSLAISSFGGRLKTRFETGMQKTHLNWKSVSIEEQDFVAVAQQARQKMQEEGSLGMEKCPSLRTKTQSSTESGEIVYLTADSDETIEELQPYSVYIIGGIVDRNRHKGICYKRAMERGIKTAKLPIGELMQMNSRVVLATNHVNEIMLKWLEVGDWGKAFVDVIPKRKGGVLKDQSDQSMNAEQNPDREDKEAVTNGTAEPDQPQQTHGSTVDVTESSKEEP